jgi:hypothetical protein
VNDEDFYEFVQGAALVIHDLWIKAGGRVLDTDELSDLTEVLDSFFDNSEGRQ